MTLLRNVVVTVAGGLLIALVLYVASAPQGPYVYLGMPSLGDLDIVIDVSGTDPWTGVYRDAFRSTPYESGNWWTIPLPISFVVGCLLVLVAIFARSDRAKCLGGKTFAAWRLLRAVALLLAGGLLMAVVLFSMTTPDFGNPRTRIGETLVEVGDLNPWTGEVRFTVRARHDHGAGAPSLLVDWEKVGPVIPLPMGFAIGSLLTLGVIVVAALRPRRTAAGPAVTTA